MFQKVLCTFKKEDSEFFSKEFQLFSQHLKRSDSSWKPQHFMYQQKGPEVMNK